MNNFARHRSSFRFFLPVVVVAGATATLILAQPTQPPPVSADWSRIVPGDARFYVELRELSSIRALWQGIGIWQTVREWTERDAEPVTRSWQRRTEELLGLGAEDAISQLLGRRSALIASDSSQWNNGVVIAELESAPDLEPLLQRWDAKQLADEGPVKRYQLGGGILLAVLDRTLVLGPADDSDGLWGRTVLLLAGRRGPSLAARSDYGALRSRVSGSPQGLLYAAWRRGDPVAFEGCTRLVAASQVSATEINCELFGQRPLARNGDFTLSAADLASLPAGTLAVWAGPIDFEEIARQSAEGRFGAPETFLGIVLEVFTAVRFGDDSLIRQLGPTCRLIVALDPAAADVGFDLPAMTALIESKKRGPIVENLDGLMSLMGAILQFRPGAPSNEFKEIPVKVARCEDTDLHSVEIGPALARRLGFDFLRDVEFAWAYVGDELLISTSRRHAELVIRAARKTSARLDESPDAAGILPPPGNADDVSECFFVRGTALSTMLTHWLDYLGRHQPQALQAEWWQTWADERVQQRDKLGLALRADPANPHQAVVVEVDDSSPAAGKLNVDDLITGAAGAPIASSQPAQDVARRYRERGEMTEFAFDVIRDGKAMRVMIPVSPAPSASLLNFDPVRAVRQLATLSRHADAVTIWRFASRKDRLDARVRVRWKAIAP